MIKQIELNWFCNLLKSLRIFQLSNSLIFLLDIMNKTLGYLHLKNVYVIICYVVIVDIMAYIQQEYVVLPQLKEEDLLTDFMREQVLGQINKYRWIAFLVAPFVVLLRIMMTTVVLYIGSLFGDLYKDIDIKKWFNIALKADLVFILSSVLIGVCLILYGNDVAITIMQNMSLLAFFNIEEQEPWFLMLVGIFNLAEVIYGLFLVELITKTNQQKYSENFNFVCCTYGTYLIIYMVIVVFATLYVSQ